MVGDKGEAVWKDTRHGAGVWKRFGLNWWGICRGRAVERCDMEVATMVFTLSLVTVNESVSHKAM
jgi:hypothetical protein